jgi:hypothetical protein
VLVRKGKDMKKEGVKVKGSELNEEFFYRENRAVVSWTFKEDVLVE